MFNSEEFEKNCEKTKNTGRLQWLKVMDKLVKLCQGVMVQVQT